MDFNLFDSSLRELLRNKEAPIVLDDGHIWSVSNGMDCFRVYKDVIFDGQLACFKDVCVDVLKQIDPRLDLNQAHRFTFISHGSSNLYSDELRKGVAESLAMLGVHGDKLKYCSRNARDGFAASVIRDIFLDADWRIWASLCDLLPVISEASPEQFLTSLEEVLHKKPDIFIRIFSEESSSFGGRTYLSGLLWALEGLAWSEKYLIRIVAVLAGLASLDPGGKWANRPINTLRAILLPWYPQTSAPIEKRVFSINSIKSSYPEVTWNLLVGLLPSQTQTASNNNKPRWRNFAPDVDSLQVSRNDYFKQIAKYSEIAFELGVAQFDRLKVLIQNFGNLPGKEQNKLLEHLRSKDVSDLDEEQLFVLWSNLFDFIKRNRKFPEANWVLDSKRLDELEVISDSLAPKNPLIFYRKIFSGNELALYEPDGNWDNQIKKLALDREVAVNEILKVGGLEAIFEFIKNVESPYQVGLSLGGLLNDEFTNNLLPRYLDKTESADIQFTAGYIWGAQMSGHWGWADSVALPDWPAQSLAKFLILMPFEASAWDRAQRWLGHSESLYWNAVKVTPYVEVDDCICIVPKLLKFSRPRAAVDCLYYRLHKGLALDVNLTIQALLDAAQSNAENSTELEPYNIAELIKALQHETKDDFNLLFKVEWAYLKILNGYIGDATPKSLHKNLAKDPHFYCEMIRLVYRPKDSAQGGFESESNSDVIANAWRLLNDWKIPPGLNGDASFSFEDFLKWFEVAATVAEKSGHYDIALSKIGSVLFYSPPDPSGLWILQSIAHFLDNPDFEAMRNGFVSEVFNSRGAHWVDASGQQERDLASRWRSRAVDVENHGYPKFAATLFGLADSYDRDAERVIKRHDPDGEV